MKMLLNAFLLGGITLIGGWFLLGGNAGQMEWVILINNLFLLTLAFVLQIILHEGGHFICGLLMGYKLISFEILTYGFYVNANGKINFGKISTSNSLGRCLMQPSENTGLLANTIYFGGGISSNIFFSLVAYLLMLYNNQYSMFLNVFIMNGLVLAIINSLPFGAIDGGILFSIWRKPILIKCLNNQLYIIGEISKGVPLKCSIQPRYFTLPEGVDPVHNFYASIVKYKYYYHLATLEIESADKVLNEILLALDDSKSLFAESYKELFYFEKLFCLCVKKDNIQEAKELYESKLKKQLIKAKDLDKIRTMIAYSMFVLQDQNKVKQYEVEARKHAKKSFYKGITEIELGLIDWMDSKQLNNLSL